MTPRHHPFIRRAAAPMLVLAVSLTACGGGDDDANPTASPAPTADETSTTVGRTTTTSDATTTTGEETTTTVAAAPVWPLTGEPLDDEAAAARSALVVKIDNHPDARPQSGFNSADLVYEEIVEGSLTRFAFVFHSGDSDPVGPIRSGRTQDIDLFGSLNHPLFAWSGGNARVTDAIHASDLIDIGPNIARGAYFRSRDRSAPHNYYSRTSDLFARQPEGSPPPAQQFAYRGAEEAPTGEASVGAEVKLRGITARWDWDAAQGLYFRETNGRVHNDANGGQVSTNNVVVLVMEYSPSPADRNSPEAQSVGSGEAFVFTGGSYVHGTWTRADRLAPFTLADDAGRQIELTPGRTFVELAETGTTTPFGASI